MLNEIKQILQTIYHYVYKLIYSLFFNIKNCFLCQFISNFFLLLYTCYKLMIKNQLDLLLFKIKDIRQTCYISNSTNQDIPYAYIIQKAISPLLVLIAFFPIILTNFIIPTHLTAYQNLLLNILLTSFLLYCSSKIPYVISYYVNSLTQILSAPSKLINQEQIKDIFFSFIDKFILTIYSFIIFIILCFLISTSNSFIQSIEAHLNFVSISYLTENLKILYEYIYNLNACKLVIIFLTYFISFLWVGRSVYYIDKSTLNYKDINDLLSIYGYTNGTTTINNTDTTSNNDTPITSNNNLSNLTDFKGAKL